MVIARVSMVAPIRGLPGVYLASYRGAHSHRPSPSVRQFYYTRTGGIVKLERSTHNIGVYQAGPIQRV